MMNFKVYVTLLCCLMAASLSFGQNTLLPVLTQSNALVFRVNEKKELEIAYLGKKLKNLQK